MNVYLACREVVVDLHGGLPRATCDLASALARAGHRVTLVTDRSPAPVPALDGVEVVRVGLDSVSVAFPGAAPETAPHNLLHAAAVWRELDHRHVHDAPVDVVLAPLWRSEGAVSVLDRRWPTVVSCMTSLQTLVELDPGYRSLPDLDQRLAFERAALQRSPLLHGLTHAVLEKTIRDFELAPGATAVVGRGVADRRVTRGSRSRALATCTYCSSGALSIERASTCCSPPPSGCSRTESRCGSRSPGRRRPGVDGVV